MELIQILSFLIGVCSVVAHIQFPESTYTSNKHGVIMHLEFLAFQYDSTYRLTIGIRMDVIPNMGDLVTEYKGWCMLKQDSRDKVWKKFNDELSNYTEILLNLTYANRGTLTELPNPQRDKRGVTVSLAIAASLSAIGMNI